MRTSSVPTPEQKLVRLAFITTCFSILSLAIARLMSLPWAPLFVILLMLTAGFRGRLGDSVLAAASNMIAVFFVLLAIVIGAFRGPSAGVILAIPYFLVTVQMYYLAHASFHQKFYPFAIAAWMTVIEGAIIYDYGVFILLFLAFIYLFLRGGAAAEHARAVENNPPPGILVPGKRSSLIRRGAALTSTILAMAVLFAVMPRIGSAGGLGFHMSSAEALQNRSRVGFGDEVRHGSFGAIADDPTVVMNVKIDKGRLRERHIRWRGRALNKFDGQSWSFGFAGTPWRWLHFSGRGYIRSATEYNTMTPTRGRNLYALRAGYRARLDTREDLIEARFHLMLQGINTVFTLPRAAVMQLDLTNGTLMRDFNHTFKVVGRAVLEERLFYSTWSEPPSPDLEERARRAGRFDPASAPSTADLFLSLPQGLDPRTAELARTLSAGKGPYEAARAIEEHLRNEYVYSLDAGITTASRDPLAQFLFEARKGHCEYFASAMAVMLRMSGIPSRVVVGFQRGEWNDLGGFYTVRQRDAHAWVEAYFEGVEWVEFDPSPRRAENIAFLQGLGWYDLTVSPVIQYLDDKYNEYVVNFNRRTQTGMFRSVAVTARAATSLIGALIGWALRNWAVTSALTTAFLAAAVIMLMRSLKKLQRRTRTVTGTVWEPGTTSWGSRGRSVARAYLKVRELLDSASPEAAPFLTAREVDLPGNLGTGDGDDARLSLENLVRFYERARFGAQDFTRAELKEAEDLAARLRRTLASAL